MDSSGVSDIDPPEFQTKGIVSLLKNINTKKASGPDGISCWVMKEAGEEIAPFLQFIFNQSLTTGQVPGDWKCANVTPVLKKGSKKEASNYRPVSLTSVPCKILEHIIFHHNLLWVTWTRIIYLSTTSMDFTGATHVKAS